MPNHCTNTLTITGPAKEIARFIKRAKSKEESLDANAFIPYPAKFRRMDERANQQRIESNKDREKFQKGEITQVQWDELWETKHSKLPMDLVGEDMIGVLNTGERNGACMTHKF